MPPEKEASLELKRPEGFQNLNALQKGFHFKKKPYQNLLPNQRPEIFSHKVIIQVVV